jgi:hypothetical protein
LLLDCDIAQDLLIVFIKFGLAWLEGQGYSLAQAGDMSIIRVASGAVCVQACRRL